MLFLVVIQVDVNGEAGLQAYRDGKKDFKGFSRALKKASVSDRQGQPVDWVEAGQPGNHARSVR
jgi:hypothetical protein